MTKIRLNHTFILVLITAFLSMQWSTAHLHLAEHHDHEGSHHQHNIEIHAHHSITHNTDTFDVSHQATDNNVVKLDIECSTSHRTKQEKPSTAVIAPTFQQASLFQALSVELRVVVKTKLSPLYYSTFNIRAPPQFS